MNIKKSLMYGLIGFMGIIFLLWLKPSQDPPKNFIAPHGNKVAETGLSRENVSIAGSLPLEKMDPLPAYDQNAIRREAALAVNPSKSLKLGESYGAEKIGSVESKVDAQVVVPAPLPERSRSKQPQIANALPTDQEIKESIRAQNEKNERFKAMMNERVSRAAMIRAQIDSLGQAQFPPTSLETKNAANETPPADIAQKVRSKEYTIVH